VYKRYTRGRNVLLLLLLLYRPICIRVYVYTHVDRSRIRSPDNVEYILHIKTGFNRNKARRITRVIGSTTVKTAWWGGGTSSDYRPGIRKTRRRDAAVMNASTGVPPKRVSSRISRRTRSVSTFVFAFSRVCVCVVNDIKPLDTSDNSSSSYGKPSPDTLSEPIARACNSMDRMF